MFQYYANYENLSLILMFISRVDMVHYVSVIRYNIGPCLSDSD